jgi:hypothetical protein
VSRDMGQDDDALFFRVNGPAELQGRPDDAVSLECLGIERPTGQKVAF